MAEKFRFEFEFDDTGPKNLQCEFEGVPHEKVDVTIEDGVPYCTLLRMRVRCSHRYSQSFQWARIQRCSTCISNKISN